MDASEIVALLGATTEDLSARIRTVDRVWDAAGSRIVGHFHYVALRDSRPSTDELIDVAHRRMINFSLPRWRIIEAAEELKRNPARADAVAALYREARDLFIKTREETRRSGELGEILLFMLVEWALGAPIVACKMYLKTNQQMPVHGQDAIHLGYDGARLIVYWGESKLHATLSSAIHDIVESISNYCSTTVNRQNEIRIMSANINIDPQNIAAIEAYKAYFNPYSELSNLVGDEFACLAGFDSPMYDDIAHYPHNIAEAEFEKRYIMRIDSAWDLVSRKIAEARLNSYTFHFFLLPFQSVEAARIAFQSYLFGRA